MTSEVEQTPMPIIASYGWHRSHWVISINNILQSTLYCMFFYTIKYSHALKEKLTFWIVASIGCDWWVGSLHLICWIKNYHIVHNTLANLMSVKFQPWNGWCFESSNLQVKKETKYPPLVNWPEHHLLFCI